MNIKAIAWSMPWGNWKGSDSMLIVHWLKWFCRLHGPGSPHEEFCEIVGDVTDKIITFFKVLSSHGLWLRRKCAHHVRQLGLDYLRGYKRLAKMCFEQERPGFTLITKCHALHHTLKDIDDALARGAPFVLSPMAFICDRNEDVVGRLSRLSRRVSHRSAGSRICDIYKVLAKAVSNKFFKRGPKARMNAKRALGRKG